MLYRVLRHNASLLMRLDELLTDGAVLAELGCRLERHRLERNWTQGELAFEAQLGRATVQRMERGRSVQSVSLIKVLRTLGLMAALDAAVPALIVLPIAELEREHRPAWGQKACAAHQPSWRSRRATRVARAEGLVLGDESIEK